MNTDFQSCDTRQEKLARMQELVTEAYESGVSDKTVDEIFDEALNRHCKNKKKELS